MARLWLMALLAALLASCALVTADGDNDAIAESQGSSLTATDDDADAVSANGGDDAAAAAGEEEGDDDEDDEGEGDAEDAGADDDADEDSENAGDEEEEDDEDEGSDAAAAGDDNNNDDNDEEEDAAVSVREELPAALATSSEASRTCSAVHGRSCASLYREGKRKNGYYSISNRYFRGTAYCDMSSGSRGYQLCGAISASRSHSNFFVARTNRNGIKSAYFSRNCQRMMRKGAILHVTRSRTDASDASGQCTFQDNSGHMQKRCVEDGGKRFASWWNRRTGGCYKHGNAYRFSVLRTANKGGSVCMKNGHWIGSNSCHCHNAFGAWNGSSYTGKLYFWVKESPDVDKARLARVNGCKKRRAAALAKRRKSKGKKLVRRTAKKATRSRRRRVAVRRRNPAQIRRARRRARIAKMRARHGAFKAKVSTAVQRYATRETQRLIKWFIATYLDKDAVSLAKPLERQPRPPKQTLNPEPGPGPSDPEPFEVKHRRKPDSPGVRDDVIPIPGLVQEKNKDRHIDVYPKN